MSPSAIAEPAPHGAGEAPASPSFWALTIGSIGVVYGDIGTSPLYALRESVLAAVGPNAPASEPVVLGILSLIIWALLLVVTAKYVLILLRADNNGEGGTLALMALASRALGRPRRHRDPVRHHQRRVVLRRRHHHAGALGALGHRRLEGRDAGLRRFRGAAHGADPDHPVFGAVARHRQGGDLLRPGHAHLVCRDRRCRPVAHRAKPECLVRLQSVARRELSAPSRHHRAVHARRGVPGGDRRGSALCRSRPFRARADPLRLADGGAAGAHHQLSRAGRAGVGQSEVDRESVLPAVSRTGRCCRWWCWRPRRP